ncbi:MAG TPA: hypothetical protein VEW28_09475 [Candidatus Kapabacteria bacterium]|nr:hypothetical protein [Candidatus Kapabacteria bacterium]
MLDDSIGRGERQARALVMLVLVIESLWIFFHKYLPLDASLWSLQADTIRLHLAGGAKDGLQIIPIPAANVLVPFVSGLLSFVFGGEVVVRLLLVFVGFFCRGFAMLSLLRALHVREALVYFLVPVIVWSGVFFVGSLPYLVAETVAIALVSFFLRQNSPRSGSYYVLMIGFAVVALCHALAFFAVVLITVAVANEQRKSVHLSQGWLSNFNRVVGLVIPGCIVLLLRVLAPAPIFMLTSSGFIGWGAMRHVLMTLAVTPHIKEAAFPGSNILSMATSCVAVLLALASLVRAFLLPMEEVSWQSRSAKGAGAILLVVSLLGFFLIKIGIETSAFIWLGFFFVIASSYSRGPGVRRGAVDKLLRSLSFITMIVAGILNGLSTNRGAEAAFDIREKASQLVQAERTSPDKTTSSVDVRFVLDSVFVASEAIGDYPSISYSATAPVYTYARNAVLNMPSRYQPRAGMLEREDGKMLESPAGYITFPEPSKYFEPYLRVMAVLPVGATNSVNFGPFAHGMKDTTSIAFSRADANFRLVIGKLQNIPKPDFAFIPIPLR